MTEQDRPPSLVLTATHPERRCALKNRAWILAGVLAAGALALQPTVARAWTLKVGSSMAAQCVGIGGSCNQVMFTLDVRQSSYVDVVRIWSLDSDRWYFGSLASVVDANGDALPWTWEIDPYDGHMKIVTSGTYAPEPIYLTVNMTAYERSETLGDDIFIYNGDGNLLADGSGQPVTFSGAVTPEPVTIVLLGSGLAGIAGVAHRRRRRLTDPS